ncbi:osteocalcin 2-like [Leguminivora glycinivorella]|uniref:osteocalcin 2-like n=1 Tax=Leguminivora glycinivorella TaxID=1035111 RepID=UPI00200F9F7D|nr:osteocalcin 2-like [Leguminivora glycinivorella]
MFLTNNSNEINVQNKIVDIGQKPIQSTITSSQQDILRNNTPRTSRSSSSSSASSTSSSSSSSRSSSTSSVSKSSSRKSNSNSYSIVDGPSTSKCTGENIKFQGIQRQR